MNRMIQIKNGILYIPIDSEKECKYLNIFLNKKQIYEFKVPEGTKEKNTFYARLDVSKYTGNELELSGDFSSEFLDDITESEPEEVNELRPQVHFTADKGWINDPNGLVYDKKKYHLYFQHNPFDIKWNNMSWGHAVSSDLLHWEDMGDVLYPDGDGFAFSGCGIKANDKLMFYYTVAGGDTPWSEGKGFIQKLAVSDDDGKTLNVRKEPILGVLGKDSRDPKIFWHEETNAYIMIIYLENKDFAILRSEDLLEFTMTQKFSTNEAWECPNLLNVPVYDEDGEFIEYRWMFTCADGFYYWGSFDGYEFKSDFIKHDAYLNSSFYAAQSYSGVDDRIINVEWMRIPNTGECYTGLMGIPRELTAVKKENTYRLVQNPVGEFISRLKKTDTVCDSYVYMADIDMTDCTKNECTIEINNSFIKTDKNKIIIDDTEYKVSENIDKIRLIVDYNIVEVGINNDIIISAFRTKNTDNSFSCKAPEEAKVEKYVFE